MESFNGSGSSRTRRNLLGSMASGAALLGLGAAGSASAAPAPTSPENAPEELFALARLRDYKSRRSSSWDRNGGNGDSVPVEPGQTATLLDLSGAGVVTHLWFTINSRDHMHLKNLVLRAWWDGESSPSVEVPIGDFFGLGLAEYYTYQSCLLYTSPRLLLRGVEALAPQGFQGYFTPKPEKSSRCDPREPRPSILSKMVILTLEPL